MLKLGFWGFFFSIYYLAVLGLSCHTQIFSCDVWYLVPWPGIKPGPPALGAWSFSHWTTREVPQISFDLCLYLSGICLGGYLLGYVCFHPWSSLPLLTPLSTLSLPFSSALLSTPPFSLQISEQRSVSQFSRSVVSDSLRPHKRQHAKPPCPSPTPRVYPNPCPSNRLILCRPLLLLLSILPSIRVRWLISNDSFPMSQLFESGGQSTGVSASASVLPMNTQDWSPLGWTGWISSQSKGLSRVFSNTTAKKH